MRTKFFLTAMLSLFLSGAALAEAGNWHTSWEGAAAEAKQSGKPILMDFTGSDWCGWCIKLKDEVFETAEFEAWAKENVVLLELDFPRKVELDAETKAQNETLAKKYEVRGFPTVIFADHRGEALGTHGYTPGGPAAWIGKAEEALAAAHKPVADKPAADKPAAKEKTANKNWFWNR